MEKYRVVHPGKEYLIEIDGEMVFIDGEPYYAGIHFLNESGLFMVEKDESKREFHIKPRRTAPTWSPRAACRWTRSWSPKKAAAKKSAEKVDSGEINAPIPGVVMEIKAAVG